MANINPEMTRQEKIQIGIIITILIVVCIIIIAIITLVRYAEEIKNNPIDYAIEHTNIDSCTCYNSIGQIAHFGDENSIVSPFDLQYANG